MARKKSNRNSRTAPATPAGVDLSTPAAHDEQDDGQDTDEQDDGQDADEQDDGQDADEHDVAGKAAPAARSRLDPELVAELEELIEHAAGDVFTPDRVRVARERLRDCAAFNRHGEALLESLEGAVVTAAVVAKFREIARVCAAELEE